MKEAYKEVLTRRVGQRTGLADSLTEVVDVMSEILDDIEDRLRKLEN